jgi:hypothetical protein
MSVYKDKILLLVKEGTDENKLNLSILKWDKELKTFTILENAKFSYIVCNANELIEILKELGVNLANTHFVWETDEKVKLSQAVAEFWDTQLWESELSVANEKDF